MLRSPGGRRGAPEPGPPRGGVKPTEDEELLNRLVPSVPRARAPELAAFTHTDPWRVLRIQSEFVYGINALSEKVDRHGGSGVTAHGLQRRLDQADRLARAVGLDMAEGGWRPTVDNYFGRVTKSRILEAVREAKGEGAAQLIEHLKKTEMAKEAERLLEDSRWLPEPLRLSGAHSPSDVTDDSAVPLPEFLADDEEKAAGAGEGEQPQPIAVE